MAKILFVDTCYADEFDVTGFIAMSDTEYQLRIDQIKQNIHKQKKWPLEIYFGTNEGIEFENAEEYLWNITDGTEELAEEDFEALKRVFIACADGTVCYGDTLGLMEKFTQYDDYLDDM